MIEPIQLRIEGYDGKPLSNLFWLADSPNGWLAVILPGRGYTSDMPLLFFTRQLLRWRGIDVLNLNPSTQSEGYQSASGEMQLAWLKSDVLAGLTVGLSQKRYKGIVLAGKSLGSLAIAQAETQAESLLPTGIAWLTPLLRFKVVMDAALKASGPQVYLCGGSDEAYIPEKLSHILAQKPLSKAFVAPGANHNLEVPGDDQATFHGFSGAMLALGAFLDELLNGSLG